MRWTALVACAWLACAPQTPLAQSTEGEEAETGEVGTRFQRAPFRTYNEQVGPQLPRKVTKFDSQNHPAAQLRQLDKMTGRIETVDVETTDEVRLGRLRIRVEACRTSEDPSLGGSIAFLKIWDLRDETLEPQFSGWMFAESPALSAFDHPRYDVWVIRCITDEGEAVTGNE